MCGCRQLHGVLAVGSGEYVEIEPHTVMLRTDYLRGLLMVGAGKLAVTVPVEALLLPAEDDWTAAYRTARFCGDHDARIARWCLEQIGVQRRQELSFQNVALAEWIRDGAVLDKEMSDE